MDSTHHNSGAEIIPFPTRPDQNPDIGWHPDRVMEARVRAEQRRQRLAGVLGLPDEIVTIELAGISYGDPELFSHNFALQELEAMHSRGEVDRDKYAALRDDLLRRIDAREDTFYR